MISKDSSQGMGVGSLASDSHAPNSEAPASFSQLSGVADAEFISALRATRERVAKSLRRMGGVLDPDDVIQDSMLKLLDGDMGGHLESFPERLQYIAVNTAKGGSTVMLRRPWQCFTDVGNHANNIVEPSDPFEAASVNELHAQIEGALQSLAPVHQDAIRLREMEQYSYQQLAEHWGCPYGTVCIRVQRARLAFEGALAQHVEDPSSRERISRLLRDNTARSKRGVIE